MSLGALKVHVRRNKQAAALLDPYVHWLLTLVSPEAAKHSQITVRVFLNQRGGQKRPVTRAIFNTATMCMEEQQGFNIVMGLARINPRRLDRYSYCSGTPDAVNVALAVHVYNEARMQTPRRFTALLVHELAHVHDIYNYLMARCRQVRARSDDDYADEVAEAAHKTLSTSVEMEQRANAKVRRVMETLTDSEIKDRTAPFWGAISMPSTHNWGDTTL